VASLDRLLQVFSVESWLDWNMNSRELFAADFVIIDVPLVPLLHVFSSVCELKTYLEVACHALVVKKITM